MKLFGKYFWHRFMHHSTGVLYWFIWFAAAVFLLQLELPADRTWLGTGGLMLGGLVLASLVTAALDVRSWNKRVIEFMDKEAEHV